VAYNSAALAEDTRSSEAADPGPEPALLEGIPAGHPSQLYPSQKDQPATVRQGTDSGKGLREGTWPKRMRATEGLTLPEAVLKKGAPISRRVH
jgi:hypothetical protein